MSSELQVIHSEILECTKCELHKSRTNAVPGEGPYDARIMFVGEGPGQNEDEQGRPFVGAAGKFLTELLESIGMKRSNVFITNIVKCRPPNNRAPRKPEIEACNPYLQSQIKLINPRIVCALGTPAITTLMGDEYSASRFHGKPLTKGGVTLLPMYHPAATLYDASLKETLFHDFQILKKLLENEEALHPDAPKLVESSEKKQTLEKWV
ncbi:MAG TPA: uracil-DNA glycosylase [Candidatus Bathyarchaeia archaeon]